MFGLRTAEIAQGLAFKFVSFSAATIMVSSFALGYVFFVWLWRRLKLSFDGERWWLIPFVWVAAEYLRSVFFSFVSFGPGGRIGAYWSFGNVGYWLVDTPLAFAARWGGLYLLCLMVAWLVVAGIKSWLSKSYKPVSYTVLIIFLLSFSGWLAYRTPTGPERSIAAVQFSNEYSPEAFSTNASDQLGRLPENSVDTIVLPEYSHLWEEKTTNDTAAATRALKSPSGLVIDSTQEKSVSLAHNLITYHAADGSHLFTQQKWFSIPGGEYVPYIYQVILAYAGQEQLLMHFNDQKSINHGEVPEQPFYFNGVYWGGLACSGAIAPDLYRGMADRGATVLTNSASLDTMGLSPLYHEEARGMARLHAIANSRPFIQAARGGLSFIFDNNGKFIDQSQKRGYQLLSGNINANETKTIYTMFGDWVVFMSIILIGGVISTKYWKQRQQSYSRDHQSQTKR